MFKLILEKIKNTGGIKGIFNKKIVYRIKNDELCGWKYSSGNLKSYTEDLTDENINEYFDWEEIKYFEET